MTPEYLYRFDDVVYADRGVQVDRKRFKVTTETPCGYWIQLFVLFPDDKKWVSKTARKRYAYPTADEAKESFVARKTRQIQILQAQLARAKTALRTIDPSVEIDENRLSRWF